MKPEFSGMLSERITLQLPVDTQDGGGGFVRIWQNMQDLWAQVSVQPQDERRYGGHIAGVTHYTITIRRDGAVPLQARLLWRGRLLSILAVADDPTAKDRLRISASEEREQ
jgi:head-tail adaptor